MPFSLARPFTQGMLSPPPADPAGCSPHRSHPLLPPDASGGTDQRVRAVHEQNVNQQCHTGGMKHHLAMYKQD